MALVLSALVSWTAVAAEEGPDPSCLLQTMAGQNLSSGLQQGQPYGWIEVCTSCFCQNIATVNAQIVSVASCITYCQGGGFFNPTTVIQFRTDRDFCIYLLYGQ